MKKKIIFIVMAVSLITVCGANYVTNHAEESPLKKMVLANIDAVAFAKTIDINFGGEGGMRCTCQKTDKRVYKCLVEGAFGFLKGRCNQKEDKTCNDDQHNKNCEK